MLHASELADDAQLVLAAQVVAYLVIMYFRFHFIALVYAVNNRFPFAALSLYAVFSEGK